MTLRRTMLALWLATGPVAAGEPVTEGSNWLRLERTSEWNRQQLRAQQARGRQTAPADRVPRPQLNPLMPTQDGYRTPPPQSDEQLQQQQQLQQQGLQQQQRRALIVDQHRQQAVPPGNRGPDRSPVQQQQFDMRQQNQLREFQLQQQIQRGIGR